MDTKKRRFSLTSFLDGMGIGVLTFVAVLFIFSALCFLLAVIALGVSLDGEPPKFTLGEVALVFGVLGMAVLPLYIVTSLITEFREKRKKSRSQVGDKAKHRAESGD